MEFKRDEREFSRILFMGWEESEWIGVVERGYNQDFGCMDDVWVRNNVCV